MAVRISEMQSRAALEGSDLFEICHIATRIDDQEGHKSFSVSAEQIAEYCKRLNNGGYMGVTDASLDDFRYANTGVYWWSGDAPLVGMPNTGILEVLSYVKPATEISGEQPVVVERLTSGNEVYCRTWTQTVGWSGWAVLKNVNGNRILSGRTKDGTINFNDVAGMKGDKFFKSTPVVTVTPVCDDATKVCIINIATIDQNGFSVNRFTSSTVSVEQKTHTDTTRTYATHNDEQVLTNENIDQMTTVTRGSWETGDFEYNWVATLDG